MPDPNELLAVARLLIDETSGPASDAQLRRAVSTAYYAVFHKILRETADRFVGPDHSSKAAYRLVYRNFDHNRVREVCLRLSLEMRDFASSFPFLQSARHRADYAPDAANHIAAAQTAMAAFDQTAEAERTDVLALMMGRSRA
jgi:shikimate 5-dehydrogenase